MLYDFTTPSPLFVDRRVYTYAVRSTKGRASRKEGPPPSVYYYDAVIRIGRYEKTRRVFIISARRAYANFRSPVGSTALATRVRFSLFDPFRLMADRRKGKQKTFSLVLLTVVIKKKKKNV